MVWDINDIKDMKQRLSAGESVASVAGSFGVSAAAIYATSRNYGISIRACRNTKQAKSARKQRNLAKLLEREQGVLKRREIREAARNVRLSEIAEARRSGLSLKAVGRKFNVSNEWVRQSVLQYNKTAKNPVPLFRSPSPPLAEITERRRKVAELRRSGLSYQEISEKLNVPKDRIKNDVKVLCERDPTIEPIPAFSVVKRKIDDKAKTEIIKARQAGQTYKQIAQKYDVTAGRIFHICQAAEISPRHRQKVKTK
jgi:DNA-binding NarL/FixJ family response regulator